jgi:uncharacterized membrane protein (DUF441 family)
MLSEIILKQLFYKRFIIQVNKKWFISAKQGVTHQTISVLGPLFLGNASSDSLKMSSD